MSYSTWHFITPSPSLGWLFRNMVLPRFVSMWPEIFKKSYMCDLIAGKLFNAYCHKMGASSIQYTATSLVPTSICQLSRPHTHAPATSSLRLIVRSQPRTSSWPSRVSVIRQLSPAAHRFVFFVSPSRSRQNCDARLLRSGRARAIDVRRSSSAVQPRHASPLTWATSSTTQFELSHLSVRAL